MKEKRIYKFVLNTQDSINSLNNNLQRFNVDWSVLPENTNFIVSFSFSSNSTSTDKNILNACVYANLGCLNNYEIGATSNYKNTNFLGFLNIACAADGTNTRTFQCDNTLNNPLFINKRPSNNLLEIRICTFYGSNFLYSSVEGLINPYVLILNFEEVF